MQPGVGVGKQGGGLTPEAACARATYSSSQANAGEVHSRRAGGRRAGAERFGSQRVGRGVIAITSQGSGSWTAHSLPSIVPKWSRRTIASIAGSPRATAWARICGLFSMTPSESRS